MLIPETRGVRVTKKSEQMFGAVDFTHLLAFVATTYVHILLSFKAIEEDVAETSIKVDLETWDYFFEDVGFCWTRSLGPDGLFSGTVLFQDANHIGFTWEGDKLSRLERAVNREKWRGYLLMFCDVFPIIDEDAF
jgi:hypothetical protein